MGWQERMVQRPGGGAEQALVALSGAFASGEKLPVPTDLAPGERDQLVRLARPHGLTPLLHLATTERETPEQVLSALKRDYVTQTARNIKALHQLREIAEALHGNGIDAIALKGAHALPYLYRDLGCRPLADLDLMVREESVPAVCGVMEDVGYLRGLANGPTDIDVANMRQGYRPPFEQVGRVPVDVHTGLLDRRGRGALAASEIWSQALPCESSGTLLCLAPPHFLLFSAWHYMKHLELSFGPLFGLMDIMLAVQKWRDAIDWDEFWRTAERWHIQQAVAVVMATLNHHWHASVPNVPEGADPLTERDMVHGVPGSRNRLAAEFIEACGDRLRVLRELPSMSSRLRYVLFWAFPPRKNLEARYGDHRGMTVLVLYIRHLVTLSIRLGWGVLAWTSARLARLVPGRPTCPWERQ